MKGKGTTITKFEKETDEIVFSIYPNRRQIAKST